MTYLLRSVRFVGFDQLMGGGDGLTSSIDVVVAADVDVVLLPFDISFSADTS